MTPPLLSLAVLLSLILAPVLGNKLHSAAQSGDTQALQALLATADERGIIPNCECWWWELQCAPCSIDDSHRGGLTPVIYAAGMGNALALGILIRAGADIDETTIDGMSAALHAAVTGNVVALQVLIEAKADLNIANRAGLGPIHAAANRGELGALKLLINSTAHLNMQTATGWSAAMYASANGHSAALTALTGAGCDLNLTSKDGKNAVIVAAEWRRAHSLEQLVTMDADLDHRNAEGSSALMLLAGAQVTGHAPTDNVVVEMVSQLIKAGANLGRRNTTSADSIATVPEDSAAAREPAQMEDTRTGAKKPKKAKKAKKKKKKKKHRNIDPTYLAAGAGQTEVLALLLNAGAEFQRERLLKFASWGARNDIHEEEMRKLIGRVVDPVILADSSDMQRSAVGEHPGQKYEGEEEDYGEVDTVLPDEQDVAAQADSLVEREL